MCAAALHVHSTSPGALPWQEGSSSHLSQFNKDARVQVEGACQELRASSGFGGKRAFSFTCFDRPWRREFGVGSGSSTSSRAPLGDDRLSVDD